MEGAGAASVLAEEAPLAEPVVALNVAELVELADLALAVELEDFVTALLAVDAAVADEAALVAEVADALALDVIDSTVFVLSTTNWGV